MAVWPHLVRRKLARHSSGSSPVRRCYVVDGSPIILSVAKISARLVGVTVERLEFRLVDVKDTQGLMIQLRISFQDLAQVQQEVTNSPEFQQIVDEQSSTNLMRLFLAKSIAGYPLSQRGSMAHFLFLVQVCAWKIRQDYGQSEIPVLFAERRPWMGVLEKYADNNGVSILSVRPSFGLKGAISGKIPSGLMGVFRILRHDHSLTRLRSMAKGLFFRASVNSVASPRVSGNEQGKSSPRLAMEYYGNLNLNEPERHSDLFFWQQSPIEGKDVLVTFAIPRTPLDSAKLEELEAHGMQAVALHPAATAIPTVPLFLKAKRPRGNALGLTSNQSLNARWIHERYLDYKSLRSLWSDIFSASDVKIWTTWYKYDANHCSIADAIKDLGGISTVYQRAFESFPSPETTIGADIVFGFSPRVAEVESQSGSLVRYHVATGYIGDHRFELLRKQSKTIYENLKSNGARHILAYTDENSSSFSRWSADHLFTQQNYQFLLEKVLNEPWLGLVIKPKVPNTLRMRLGPVNELLKRAEATGRCHLFDQGDFLGSRPPSEAALAADIAIHGHLCAATAGMEAALAGVPTLLIDREGWSVSPLYRLGVGQVVFTDWDDLWTACLQHWASIDGTPGFGNWSPLLNELDPFRDGGAAKRMGTYLHWLLEGFQAGHDRESIMADAAQRYCDIWGNDKVTTINGEPCLAPPERPLQNSPFASGRLS